MYLSKIVTIHKGGSFTDYNNFRPISLVSIFSKFFDTVLLNKQFQDHLISNKFLTPNQFEYQAIRSTTLVALLNTINTEQEGGKYVGATFCDLQKAFDCVSQNFIKQTKNISIQRCKYSVITIVSIQQITVRFVK